LDAENGEMQGVKIQKIFFSGSERGENRARASLVSLTMRFAQCLKSPIASIAL
jgi:hypothetical protein